MPETIRVKLCGTQGCCPEVAMDKDAKTVIITDDHGGRVQLTTEEWQEARTKPELAV